MKKYLPLLKRIKEYIDTSEFKAGTAVYISPAQRLRNQANEIEQRENDWDELGQMIEEIENN